MLKSINTQKIIDSLQASLNKDFHFIDQEGMVLASTFPQYINSYIEGNFEIEHQKIVDGTLHLPIHFRDEQVGVLGIHQVQEHEQSLISLTKHFFEQMIHFEIANITKYAQNDLLKHLLQKRIDDELVDQLAKIDIQLSVPRKLYMVKISDAYTEDDAFSKQKRIQTCLGSIQKIIHPDEYFIHLDDHFFVWFAAEDRSKVSIIEPLQTLGYDVLVLEGYCCQSQHDYHTNYQMLETLANLPQIVNKKRGWVLAKDYMLDLIMDDISVSKKQFIVNYLTPEGISKKELHGLYELAAVMIEASFSIQKASQLANVHRNSIVYRLDKTKERYNINLLEHKDALNLILHRSLKENLSNIIK